jgi:hypothetical protein
LQKNWNKGGKKMEKKWPSFGIFILILFLSFPVCAQEIDEELLTKLKMLIKDEIKEEVLEEIQEKYVLVPREEHNVQGNPGEVEIAEKEEENENENERNGFLSYQLGHGLKVAGERMILRGFSDITFEDKDIHSKRRSDGNESFFALGHYNLFITSRLGDRVSFIGETAVEVPEGSTEMKIDIERLLVRYSIADFLNVSVGKYHTPLGYWNTAYAHGRWLHTTIFRPDLFRWEDDGGVLPTHQVGVKLDGRLPIGPFDVGYELGVSNGRGNTPDLVQDTRDMNDQKSISLSLDFKHYRIPGLTFGVSFYHDDIPESETSPVHVDMDEFIYGAHLTYLKGNYEFLAEVLNIHHDNDGSSGDFDTIGYYLQMARRWGKFKPYYRLDGIDFDKEDPFFSSINNNILKHSLGLRYEVADFNALKFEFSFADTSEGDVAAIALQTAFSF